MFRRHPTKRPRLSLLDDEEQDQEPAVSSLLHRDDNDSNVNGNNNNNSIYSQQRDSRTAAATADNDDGAATSAVAGDGDFVEQQESSLPLAPNIQAFLETGDAASGELRYRPRPEWYCNDDRPKTQQEEGGNINPTAAAAATSTSSNSSSSPWLFGRDNDFALHVCIRRDATEGALFLLRHGANPNSANGKGVTPLILAAQKGNLRVTRALLLGTATGGKKCANPHIASYVSGTTAVLQASHFGRSCEVLELLLDHAPSLLEVANARQTTPLMRAAQEGNLSIVELLLARNANVNRRNGGQLTALMLASQRGHDRICKMLVEHGADVDAITTHTQHSTSLLLACKRGHANVVKVLLEAGCNMYIRDARGRNARSFLYHHHYHSHHRSRRPNNNNNDQATTAATAAATNNSTFKALAELIDPTVQINLMQYQARRRRSYELVRMWYLLQQERAHIRFFNYNNNFDVDDDDHDLLLTIHDLRGHANRATSNDDNDNYNNNNNCGISSEGVYSLGNNNNNAASAVTTTMTEEEACLIRTMILPAPLVQMIAQYVPLPHLWSNRIGMLTQTSMIDPDATVMNALDLIDEILDEGGFVDSLKMMQEDEKESQPPPPPSEFTSWREYKICLRTKACVRAEPVNTTTRTTTGLGNTRRPDVTTATIPAPPADPDVPPTYVELRRRAGYLPCLAKSPALVRRLSLPPYNIPTAVLQQLIVTSDIASLTRRTMMMASAAAADGRGGGGGTTSSPPSPVVHYEASVAMDLVMLASKVGSWYWREREIQQRQQQHPFRMDTSTACRAQQQE